ncbi:TRAF3IP1 [Scenedesmus sp. PABB004]|nr:TRAF3IP1 [Scenedesmus sp. PABB004]
MAEAPAPWVALTQAALQAPGDALVERPKLTDKLLAKPPFRFLHDVISVVRRAAAAAARPAPGGSRSTHTGPRPAAAGPSAAAASQDKEGKVAYLAKIISVVGLALGQPIVAGLEPEATNAFLQMLGAAARLGPAADAVQRVLAGEQPTPAAAGPASGLGAGGRRTSEVPPAHVPEPQLPDDKRTYKEVVAEEHRGPPPQQPAQSHQPQPQPPQQQVGPQDWPGQPAPAAPVSAAAGAEPRPTGAGRRAVELQDPGAGPGRPGSPGPGSPAARQLGGLELARPPSGGASRPMSAKKAPPRIASPSSPVKPGARPASGARSAGSRRSTQPDRPLSGAPGSAAAPPGRAAGAAGDSDDDDDDEAGGAARAVAAALAAGGGQLGGLGLAGFGPARGDAAAAAAGAKGVLVRDILDAEAQLQRAGADAAGAAGEDQGGGGIILRRQAKPAAGGGGGVRPGDLVELSGAVQKLCQVALPLGGSMQFLQEDVDSMSKEFWTTERRVYQERLGEEQRAAADLPGLRAQLADRDAAIAAARGRVLALRGAVLQGEAAIARLLEMAVAGGGGR